MSELKDLVIPFLIGGSIITGVKYASTHIKNPVVAAIIGGIPTGLISIYFINDSNVLKYSYNYFFITLALLTSIVIFHILYVYTNLQKDVILLISLLCWALFIGIRYTITNTKKHD